MEKIFIVLPAYCEGEIIKNVISSIKAEGYNNIIVVDDGSTDNTYTESLSSGAITIKHTINRGKGAATQTGLDAAKLLGADITVTMDSDGQHNPKDIEKLIKPIIENKADVVLGSRMLGEKGMPFSRVLMNKIGNAVNISFLRHLGIR
jgi:glycosyltransferase involved in cell wall biosynthesis